MMKIKKVAPALIFLLMCILPATILPAVSSLHLDFNNDTIGALPAGWDSNRMDEAKHIYSVRSENGKKFLHADARRVSVPIGREVMWNLEEFPLLRWEWRANRFPDGSNERTKNGNDSVLGLYIVFGKWPLPHTIKYIWSDTLPVGETFDSPFSSRTKLVVLRSGRSQKGDWIEEERDVLADYMRLFPERERNPTAHGIGILTDSDSTRSRAIGGYSDLRVIKERTAPATG
ncbi:MAG: DUF3047 domain-containing protein [Desulfobacteraceae bacterium]|nr:MAG: DUF3047 domain-containing protein [Desulfobacteraceae bacterium]